MSRASTILVGMAAGDAHRRAELLALAEKCGAELAFLQRAEPSLGAVLTRLADRGAAEIRLAGLGVDRLAPGLSWLSRIAAHWLRERPEPRPALRVASRLLRTFQPAELERALTATRPVGDGLPGLTSAAWEAAPAGSRQVLVCRGPRCTAQGAEETHHALVLAAMEHGLSDADAMFVPTGCQFPCNHAPLVSVQPDNVWYGPVDPDAARDLVAGHLRDGAPLARLRLG